MTRTTRILIAALMVTGFASRLSGQSANAPISPSAHPTIVLVHGAFADGSSWSKVIPIWSSQWDGEVRSAAHHAFLTVGDRCRVDARSRQLLDELATRTPLGIHAYPHWFRRALDKGIPPERVRYPKAAIRDVPTLIEELASGDADSIRDAIASLCPSDGRNPAKKAWRAIVETRRSPDLRLREKADIAADRLDTHAMSCDRRHE